MQRVYQGATSRRTLPRLLRGLATQTEPSSSRLHLPTIRAAACHVSPVYLDAAGTVDKTIKLIREASTSGADLVVFPETYIAAFPTWAAVGSPLDGHDMFNRLARESIYFDGPEIASIAAACADRKIHAVIGFNERSRSSIGCLWNSCVTISNEGKILNHHRKIAPTFTEKLVWAPGDGAGLQVCETEVGRIGALICGENGNALARFALMAQAEQVHCSLWPPVWPTARFKEGPKGFDIYEAVKLRARAHSFECKAYSIACSAYFDPAQRDYLISRYPDAETTLRGAGQSPSFFVDPTGTQIGPEMVDEEGIVYCDLDLTKCIEPKQLHDFAGGYNRWDIFKVEVNKERQVPVRLVRIDY